MGTFRFSVKGFWAIALLAALVFVGICLGRGDWLGSLGALALTVGIVVAHRDGDDR